MIFYFTYVGFEGLRSFVDHIIHQHPITTIQSDLNSISTGTALNTTRPVIYIFPGHGIASQSCALFAIQGFTALLGGSYTSQTVPNWWSMVKHLPKLVLIILNLISLGSKMLPYCLLF